MADPVSIAVNIAIQAAISLAIAALTPKQNQEGPRLEDLSITTSTYGNTIPIGYGTVSLAGNVIWGREIREVANKQNIGKGNPFSAGTLTTYEYFATFAVGLAYREATALLRIYADGKLIFVSDTSEPTRMRGLSFNFYYGSEDQLPDPIIASDYPDGETPAYRGLCYIVFNDLPLKDFGNRIPQTEFVISFADQPKGNRQLSYPGISSFTTFDVLQINHDEDLLYTYQGYTADLEFDPTLQVADSLTGERLIEVTAAQIRAEIEARGDTYYPSFSATGRSQQMLIGGNTPYLITMPADSQGAMVVLERATMTAIKNVTTMPGAAKGNAFLTEPITTTLFGTIPPGNYYEADVPAVIEVIGLQDRYYIFFAAVFNAPTGVISSSNGIGYTESGIGANQGWIATFRLPDMTLVETNRRIGGTFSIGVFQVVQGFQGLGYTDVYASVSRSLNPDFNMELWRFRIGATGYLISETLLKTEDQIGDRFPYGVNGNLHLQYDANRDILLYQYTTLDALATAKAAAFYMNSDGNRGLPLDIIEEIFSGNPGNFTSQVSDTSSWDLDGVYFYWEISPDDLFTFVEVSLETGEVTNRYYGDEFNKWGTDQFGDKPTLDREAWKYDWRNRRLFSSYRQIDKIQAYYIDPPGERGAENLQTVVDDITLRSKLVSADTDTDDLATKFVKGYIITTDMTYRQALEPLATVYNFYGVENAGNMVFEFKGTATDKTIPEDDLVSRRSGENVFEEARTQESEIPRALYVEYMSSVQKDEISVQGAKRTSTPNRTVNSLGEVRFQFPMVLSDDEALETAVRILYESWVQQEKFSFDLSQRYLDLLPNDVLNVTAEGRAENIRIDKVGVGAPLNLRLEGRLIDGDIYSTGVVGVPAIGTPNWGKEDVIGAETYRVFGGVFDAPFPDDIFATKDRSAGSLYLAAAGPTRDGGDFAGAYFAVSVGDAPYQSRASTTQEMSYGLLLSMVPALPNPYYNGIHEVSVNLRSINGSENFSSVTRDDMLANDANAAMLWGPETGFVEFINFRDVTDNEDGTLTLTGLIRGKRGTDTQADRWSGRVYLILMTTDTFTGYWEGNSLLNADARVKALPLSFENIVTAERALTYEHRSLKPYAPVLASISIQNPSDGERVISWTRRTRLGGAGVFLLGVSDMPLSEDTESYSVDILSGAGGAVLRTLTSSETQVAYTAEQADEDFGTDFPNPLHVKIYQISAQVGRGFAHEIPLYED